MSFDKVPMAVYHEGRLAYYEEQKTCVERAVLTALKWLHTGLVAQDWAGVKSPESLVEYVIDEFDLLLVGQTLVAYSVGEAWFLEGRIISEEFVAPLGDQPADLAQVVDALEKLGQATGCSRLSLGTRANPRQEALARLFRKSGLSMSTIELTKEIPHVEENR